MKTFLDKIVIQLRLLRESRGYSQQQMADLINVGLRSYQRYESGESIPSIDLLYQACKVLDFELKDLFDNEEAKTYKHFVPHSENEQTFMQDQTVKSSGIVEFINSPTHKKLRETGDVEQLIQIPEFMHAQYAFVVATPKLTILNHMAKSQGCFSQNIIPTHLPHQNKIHLVKMWAYLIEMAPASFEHKMELATDVGMKQVKGKYFFHKNDGKYFVTGVLNYETI